MEMYSTEQIAAAVAAAAVILSMYRGGAPSRIRLDSMIIRFGQGAPRAAIEGQLQREMGMAYPRRTGRR